MSVVEAASQWYSVTAAQLTNTNADGPLPGLRDPALHIRVVYLETRILLGRGGGPLEGRVSLKPV